MIDNVISKYLHGRKSGDKQNMERLEELTEKIISLGSAPEYPIMQVLIELSENGVVGLDKDGAIIFSNSSMNRFLNEKNLNGKKIYDVIKGGFSTKLKDFIENMPEKKTMKIEIEAEKTSEIYDIVAYRVRNGSICYIIFFINCMDHLLFNRENCPLKNNCPLNNKCQNIGEKNENCNLK